MTTKITLGTWLAITLLGLCQVQAADTEQAVKEIQQTGQKYVAAFNRGDAKAIAELWTANGEYVVSDGQRFQGREVIQREFEAFFAENPGAKVHVKSDKVQLVDDDTAIEDGRSVIGEDPNKALSFNRYTAVFVKDEGGRWLLASIRDKSEAIPMQQRLMGHLDWMVGTWGVDEGDVQLRAQCRWIANKRFLERTFAVRKGEEVILSGTQIIGWDPTVRAITSWVFDSSGGHGRGVWTPVESGWTIDEAGILPNGLRTRAENHIKRVSENSLSWKSVKRKLGDATMPDLEEIVLEKR